MQQKSELPLAQWSLGITGHRDDNSAFAENRTAIAQTLDRVFSIVASQVGDDAHLPVRLVSPLAQGADMLAARQAVDRGWELVAPLPFGLTLNLAMNLGAEFRGEVPLVLADGQTSAEIMALKHEMQALAAAGRCFELAEQDEAIAGLLRQTIAQPGDEAARIALAAAASEHSAAAARIVVEQSDLLVAIWDGLSPGAQGGTRHTMEIALALGLPVLWIDAAAPADWSLLRLPEDLAAPVSPSARIDAHGLADWLAQEFAINSDFDALKREQFGGRNSWLFAGYRLIEQWFGRPGRDHAAPSRVPTTAPAPMASLPGLACGYAETIADQVLRRFEHADAVATRLSDTYRGGMILNFALSALAIMGGLIYLPLTGGETKWPFALFEFVLLLGIVLNTQVGRRRRWHSRWFQTRRVAEYLRHAPMLLLAGVARTPGGWPRGKDSTWPEDYARQTLRRTGLPAMRVSQDYLRSLLGTVMHAHASDQEGYHRLKAARLAHVHHRLDHLSERCFQLAVATVALYLLLAMGEVGGIVPEHALHALSKLFTFLGVAFPTLGGAIAGIRYFGDFERFAAISEITAAKLAAVRDRIERLQARPELPLHYAQVADLANAIDAIVISEIENWQAVFASKAFTVPV